MKKLTYLFCCLFVLLFSCQRKSAESNSVKFSLTGRTNNIPDGTIIYFLDILTNQVFDSTSIYNNYFYVERVLLVSPIRIYFLTKDSSEFKSLWIENTSMNFDASESSFNAAKVTGSKTQDELDLFLELTDTIKSEEILEMAYMEFIEKHPQSRISASMLAGYAPNWGTAKVKELFYELSKENKESVYGLQISKFIEINRNHEIGDKFTDFEMNNPTGQILRFSKKIGHVTLLEFWASWCGPCRAHNPGLVKTYNKYNKAGFEILSVSLDFSSADWEKAIEKDSLTWNHVSDLKGRNSTAGMIYGVNGIPDNFLIDADGIIIAKYLWGDELNKAIENELNKK